MRLKTKMLLAQAPLLAALLVVCVFSGLTARRLGARPSTILVENFRSIVAAEAMRDVLEEAERSTLVSLLDGKEIPSGARERWIRAFETPLQIQERNLTEPGEREATRKLSEAWSQLRLALESYSTPKDRLLSGQLHAEQLGSKLAATRNAVKTVLVLNYDAMSLKSELARRSSGTATSWMLLASLAAGVFGLAGAVTLVGRVLRPFGVLNQAVRRIGAGDFGARVSLAAGDEVAELASEINIMAGHLIEYKTSSIGELLEAQHAAQAAIDSLRDPVAVYNLDGDVIIANAAARSLRGLGLEILAHEAPRILDPALIEVVERVRAHVLSGRGPFLPQDLDEAVPLQADGAERWLLPHAAPLYGPRGAIKGVTLVLQDVTKLHRFAQFKTDLVATAAHELRTPLTSLQMAVHLCLEGGVGPLTETQLDLLHAARSDCDRLQALVEELLQLSKLEGGAVELKRQRVPAADLLRRAVELHQGPARDKGIELLTDPGVGAEEVEADPERVARVLDNLVTNAIRHTPPGGRIHIGLYGEEAAVRFEVRDTGQGIPRELQDRVFDRFFQLPGAPFGGTGLGLAIAREIVLEHGGQIGVRSEPGAGASFWFTLPRWQIIPPRPEQPEAVAEAQPPS